MNPNNIQNSVLDQVVPRSSGLGTGIAGILNQLFYAGLVVAVALALAMVIRGAIQYMTTDGGDAKGSAKKRIQAALGGLVLAFSAILVLNTINPSLTQINLNFKQLTITQGAAVGLEATPNEVRDQIVSSVNQYEGITPEVVAEMIRTGQIPSGLNAASQKVLAEALNAVGNMDTGAIPGTDGGNLACAAAVNKIIEKALGYPINNSLSTVDMQRSLASSDKFALIGSDLSMAMPGDVIISPTGAKVGHVGIAATQGATSIISNSSSAAEVRANFTAESWSQRYTQERNLPLYIYRPR